MHQTFTYDLAFVGPSRRPRTAPEIVFIIEEHHLPEVVNRLSILTRRLADYIDAYLGENAAEFELPEPDLFGNKEFGYRKCGYWTVENGRVSLRLQLQPHPWTSYCTMTIFLLTRAFGLPFEDGMLSNRQQQASINTIAQYDRAGHSVGGWVSMSVVEWLRDYAKDKIQRLGIIDGAPMHPEVIRAQQATWAAISSPRMQRYASERAIYGWIREEGSFSLNCFGDACDLSIYPDQWRGERCETVEFGCHNLDNADQQLTLLVGLVKICQLARESS